MASVPDKYSNRSLLCSKATPYAVLDLHFSEFENSIFAVATSAGLLYVFALELGNDQSVSMRNISSHQITDPSILVLSMAWSISSCNPSTIAVSLSNGQIAMFDYKVPDGSVRYIQAHTLEAWTVAWSATSDMGGHPSLYSGGDDSAVCEHGERYLPLSTQEADELSTGRGWEKISCDTKTHSAGVTAILVLSLDHVTEEEIILTGSYDEYMRVIVSAAAGRRAKVLAEKQLGGGVWRLKLLDSSLSKFGERKIVLASCMHAGPKVVEVIHSSENIWTIDIMATFEEHKSMNYASDARKEESKNGVNSMTCVSTSFYDKKLCVWNIEKC